MMIPYFIFLVILAGYGLHRYGLSTHYYKYRKKRPGRHRQSTSGHASPSSSPSSMSVTLIERLVEAISRSIYPRETPRRSVSTIPPTKLVKSPKACVDRHRRRQACPITYIHRHQRGRLQSRRSRERPQTSRGEFVAIFDADFIPNPTSSARTVPYFLDGESWKEHRHGQTRWTYLNRDTRS